MKKLDSVVIFICISRDTFFFCPASSSHNDHFSFYEILASQQRQTECTEILKANAGTFTYKKCFQTFYMICLCFTVWEMCVVKCV